MDKLGIIPPGNYTLGPCDDDGWAEITEGSCKGRKVHIPLSMRQPGPAKAKIDLEFVNLPKERI